MRAVHIVGLLCLCLVLASSCAYCAEVKSKDAAPAKSAPMKLGSATIYGSVVGGDGALVTGNTYSVNSVYSLQVRVLWKEMTDGLHVMQLRFTTPEGNIYETVTTPFMVRSRPRVAAAGAECMFAQLRDVSHPVAVTAARPVPGRGQEVWAELLMAGTWAQRLPGVWKMEVLLDDQPTVFDTQSFTLEAGGVSE